MADIKTLVTKGDLLRPAARLSAIGAELRVLVTGFAPFGEDPYNPSGVAAKALDGLRVDALGRGGYYAARIIGRGDIPVHFGDEGDSAADAVLEAILAARPDLVICLGQGDDLQFRVELRARDNAAHHDPRIRTQSPEYRSVYSTSLDADGIVAAIRSANGDATTSEDAGFYVCEDVFYHLMRYVETRPGDLDIRVAGFIHVPRFVVADTGSRVAQGAGDAHAVPNKPRKTGDTPVKQSMINDAIFKAIEAAVAGVPAFLDGPIEQNEARFQHG